MPPIRLLPGLISNANYVQAAGTPGQAHEMQNGYLLFRRDEALMAQRFNPTRLSLSGDASLIVEKIGGGVLWAAFSVSENGTLVYAPAGSASAVQLVWWDRTGKQVGKFGPPGIYDSFRLAPDERRMVFANSSSDNNRDVWVLDSVRGVTSRSLSIPRSTILPCGPPTAFGSCGPQTGVGCSTCTSSPPMAPARSSCS